MDIEKFNNNPWDYLENSAELLLVKHFGEEDDPLKLVFNKLEEKDCRISQETLWGALKKSGMTEALHGFNLMLLKQMLSVVPSRYTGYSTPNSERSERVLGLLCYFHIDKPSSVAVAILRETAEWYITSIFSSLEAVRFSSISDHSLCVLEFTLWLLRGENLISHSGVIDCLQSREGLGRPYRFNEWVKECKSLHSNHYLISTLERVSQNDEQRDSFVSLLRTTIKEFDKTEDELKKQIAQITTAFYDRHRVI